MNIIFFGLVPFLVSGLFVYITEYSKRQNPNTYQIVIWLTFVGYYIYRFNILTALLLGVAILVLRQLWVNAVRKDRRK